MVVMLLCAGAVHAAPDYFVLVHNHGKIVNTPDTGGRRPRGREQWRDAAGGAGGALNVLGAVRGAGGPGRCAV